MRLFLLALGTLALCGCSEAGAGAVRVEIFYATFHPGCLTVTALDEADASRTETQQLTVEERNSDAKTVAVFRKTDWSRSLRVIASAHEISCAGPVVATSVRQVEVPASGSTVVYLDLRAEDLDGDGYVAMSETGNGTDCDDTDPSVHPGAPDPCDGKDNNCSGDEEDATGKHGFYMDADGDGYGNRNQAVVACVLRPGIAEEAGDCDDTDAAVHPNQPELRCDGKDDDCDGAVDEDFQLDSACTTELGCAGTRQCKTDGSGAAECRGTALPVTWYVDGDGDGLAGTVAALSCTAPADAKPTLEDCDDTSRFVGGAEVCDWLDNDCDGTKDEGGVCSTNAWTTRTLGSTAWEAVTTYAPGKAWLAGPGGWLAHVSGSEAPDVRDVCGTAADWKAAWARPSDGRVFVGTVEGTLASALPLASGCTMGVVSDVPGTVTGLVGFERNGTTTVYAVTNSGHVLRWEWSGQSSNAPPVVVTRLAADLRSVHGLGPDSLLAVGAEDFQLGGTPLPRAFRLDAASGSWIREELPMDVGTGFLRGVSVADGGRAYAVGDEGLVLARQAGTWRKLPPPGGTAALELLDVAAFHDDLVFVLSNKSGTYLHRFDGTAWSEPFPQAQELLSLDAITPREQWAAGQGGTLVRWGPP